jgi:hypothetical protein
MYYEKSAQSMPNTSRQEKELDDWEDEWMKIHHHHKKKHSLHEKEARHYLCTSIFPYI